MALKYLWYAFVCGKKYIHIPYVNTLYTSSYRVKSENILSGKLKVCIKSYASMGCIYFSLYTRAIRELNSCGWEACLRERNTMRDNMINLIKNYSHFRRRISSFLQKEILTICMSLSSHYNNTYYKNVIFPIRIPSLRDHSHKHHTLSLQYIYPSI